MKTVAWLALLLVFAAGGFVAGSLRDSGGKPPEPDGYARQILYYVDPMNPTHTSDRPGFAPCGMKMEPIYADSPSASPVGNGPGTPAAGSVKVSPERQQLVGIQTAPVERNSWAFNLRLLGRVAADETRVYRIKAALGGYLGRTHSHSVGSRVQKDEVLAELKSPELLPAVQSLLFALGTRNRPADGASLDFEITDSVFEFDLSYQQNLETLRHMGMGQRQLDEVIRTRKVVQSIAITAPASGVLLARQASDELHVGMGEELFRVADLSRVWVLTDVAGWEREHLKPGGEVRVTAPGLARVFPGRVSETLPLFDPLSRTLKVRIEVDNPDCALTPDMFVDVELPVVLPEMIHISAAAVLDTGLRKSVFLDRGDGYFEPREVKTGRHLGETVEVLDGLTPGEHIVTAGNFLLDSESRMKQAAAIHAQAATAKDPVCNMTVDAQAVTAEGQVSLYTGQRFYFCNPGCKRSFDAEPAKYLKPPSTHAAITAPAAGSSDHRP